MPYTITHEGLSMAEWARRLGLASNTLTKRVRSGMTPAEAVAMGKAREYTKRGRSPASDGLLPPDEEPARPPKPAVVRRFGARF